MTPSEDQLMALNWVSARVVNQCSEVSEESTDSIFRETDYGSRGCLSGREEGNVLVIKLEEIWPIRAMEGGEAEGKYSYRDNKSEF
jgi:hypothetical protein